MKNLKLLPLLGIVMCALLSFAYSNHDNLVKDGTYNAMVKKGANRDGRGFTNNVYSTNVTVKIENGIIEQITANRDNVNAEKLLHLPLNIDSKGNAFVEATDYEQNVYNKRDEGRFYTYKLTIKKTELVK